MDDRGMPEASKRNAHVSHSLSTFIVYPFRFCAHAIAAIWPRRYLLFSFTGPVKAGMDTRRSRWELLSLSNLTRSPRKGLLHALCTLLYTWCRASDDGEGAVLIADEALDVQPTARMQLRKHR